MLLSSVSILFIMQRHQFPTITTRCVTQSVQCWTESSHRDFPFWAAQTTAKKRPVITGSGLHLKQVKGGASRNFLLIDRIFNFYMIFTVNWQFYSRQCTFWYLIVILLFCFGIGRGVTIKKNCKTWKYRFKIHVLLHVFLSRSVAQVGVFGGPILAPAPDVWHRLSVTFQLKKSLSEPWRS